MKNTWLTLAGAMSFLTGCATSMMYGQETAPVTDHSSAGRTAAQATVVQAPFPTYAHQAQTPSHASYLNASAPYPDARARVPAPAQTQMSYPYPPAAEVVHVPQVQVKHASPYAAGNDGWGSNAVARAENGVNAANTKANVASIIPDEPRIQAEPVVIPEAVEQVGVREVLEPLRPAAREEKAVETTVVAAPAEPVAEDSTASANTQVASLAKPVATNTGGREAVSTFVDRASAALSAGDLDGAAAHLENANRIAPKNAKILFDIANIRFHQKRYRDAESFASRAVQVGGDRAILKKSWSLISKARAELGDNQGAIMAAERATSL